MKKTLKTVENDIVLSVVISVFCSIIVISCVYFFLDRRSDESIDKIADSEMRRIIDNYTLNFISNIGIIVNSTEINDFIRSGPETRTKTHSNVLRVMSAAPVEEELSGWKFIDNRQRNIISAGIETDYYLSLELCYLSSGLNPEFGNCTARLIIYFNRHKLMNKLISYDDRIKKCKSCKIIHLFNSDIYSSFNVDSNVSVSLAFSKDKLISIFPVWIFLLFPIAGLLSVAFWSKKRIADILKKDVVNPITSVCKGDLSRIDEYETSTVEEIVDINIRYQLLQTRAIATEKEKRRIANELHDALGPIIIKLRWDVYKLLGFNKDNSKTQDLIKNILGSVDHLFNGTNDIIELLRPEVIDTLGLKRAIESIFSEWECVNKFSVKFDYELGKHELPDIINQAIYRIIQEAMTNLVKHSHASKVTISLCYHNKNLLKLSISDNGVGFSVEDKRNHGHGIVSMKERAISIGGELRINSSKDSGTTIEALLPTF